MKPLNLVILREAVAAGRIAWRRHVLQRLAERGVGQQTVRMVMLEGERIRDYPEDKPFPSALFLGYASGRPLHVVAACDEARRRAFVVTVYEPSPQIFEANHKTRRQP